MGGAKASWTRGLVERHGAYVRSMVEKMVHDGEPDDMSVQSLFDKGTSAKNMMRRIRGYSPSQWVLATHPRMPESLMIDDEDEHHVPHQDIPESQDDELIRSLVLETQSAVPSSLWTQIRDFAGMQSRPLVLTS